jgi:hypothetical protein
MNDRALAIAEQLAALIRTNPPAKNTLALAPSRDILPESGSEATPLLVQSCFPAAQPLSRAERQFALEAEQRLRNFYASRHYARLRIRARRERQQ